MNQPKVSIGLPVYNGDDYLPEALDSPLCRFCLRARLPPSRCYAVAGRYGESQYNKAINATSGGRERKCLIPLIPPEENKMTTNS